MKSLPDKLETKVASLSQALAAETVAAFDFETSDVRPRNAIIAGLGVYLPEQERCFYINVGHQMPDTRFPSTSEADLTAAITPFLSDPSKQVLMHNAVYDLRLLFKLGIDVRCRVSCTLVHTHRTDENIKEFGDDFSHHYHVSKVSYGLKELTTIFFNQRPPTLHDAAGAKNTISAPVYDVATYCVQDCLNTYNLFERAKGIIDCDPQLRQLIDGVDDPNNVVLAKMMWDGVLVDVAEAGKQKDAYENAIQACREEIWNTIQTTQPLDKPKHVVEVLKSLGLTITSRKREVLEAYLGENLEEAQSDALGDEAVSCTDPKVQKVIALFLSKMQMEQRCSSFLVPLPEKVRYTGGRLYPDRFSSTLATTRFSSSPNLQNLPGKADKVGPDDTWRELIPAQCKEHHTTRNLFIAKPGYTLVAMDLSAAEPRYLAMLFQRALQDKGESYRSEKKTRQAIRQNKYPVLMKKMRDTQALGHVGTTEIEWPQYIEDPLWKVFKYGQPFDDPYNALLAAMDKAGYEQAVKGGTAEAWLKDYRWRGKRAFLALAYGSQAETLAPHLKWTVKETQAAIRNLEQEYATLKPLAELTLLELVHLGGSRSLAGRPRRINGYWELTHPEPLTVGFYRMKPNPRKYQARIIPLGTTRMGVQAFVEECCVELDEGTRGEVVLAGDPATGLVTHISKGDPFARADHFNRPPFRNINYSQINWVRDGYGLTRHLPEQARAQRQAFNAMCQSTGADHLRWIMNNVDAEVCRLPKFCDCRLVLTMHDSLLYEIPEAKAQQFVDVVAPIVTRSPAWADIDIKAKVEIGRRFGDMKEIPVS